jgi:ribonuclease R
MARAGGPSREAVRTVLSVEEGPLHIAEVTKRLGLAPGRRRDVADALDALVSTGEVLPMSGGRYRLVETREEVEATGELTVNPRGFGFLRRDDGGPDVFVDVEGLGGALHRDRVRLAIHDTARGPAGRVVAILERGVVRVPGTLRARGKGTWLEPDDTRLRGPVVLPEGAAGGRDGQAVVVRITRYPERAAEAIEGVVEHVLGEPGEASTEIAKVLLREGLDAAFPAEVAAEAGTAPQSVRAEDVAGRTDLRGLDLLTIDPEDARDHDDAVHVAADSDGFRVTVAIADVAHYVRPGTALDAEARDRATSVYLPDRVIPMLPHPLSAGICSLVPEEDRLCLAVVLRLGPKGERRGAEVFEAVMRSRARLTYGGVARALGLTPGRPADGADRFRALLEPLHAAATKLRARRMQRGSIDFSLPEARVRLDPETGVVGDVVRRAQDPGEKVAYQMIEEMMLAANEAVANDLIGRGEPAIFRIHGAPDPEKLALLVRMAKPYGIGLDVDAARRPAELAAFARKLEGRPIERPFTVQVLRAMQQAVYDTTNIGHYGLAAKSYLHFTSPIRRYPDLAVHRIVKAVLHRTGAPRDGSPAAEYRRALQEAAAVASRRERRAMDVEREVVALYRALLARGLVGEEREGTVMDVGGAGIYVELDEPFLDGAVPFDELGDDRFDVDEERRVVVGRRTGRTFALGDRLRVRIADVSIARRSIRFALATAASDVEEPRARRRRELEKAKPRGRREGGRKRR